MDCQIDIVLLNADKSTPSENPESNRKVPMVCSKSVVQNLGTPQEPNDCSQGRQMAFRICSTLSVYCINIKQNVQVAISIPSVLEQVSTNRPCLAHEKTHLGELEIEVSIFRQ